MSEEQTPPGVQDPAPAAPNPGPWANDLAQFADAAVQAQVDQLLRTKIQPRMTQLEQNAAQAAEAQRLMNDLVNNPQETMAALAAELQWQPEPFVEQPPVDPRMEQVIADFEQRQNLAAYEAEMQRVVTMNPGVNPDLLHPFVSAADGNFDEAVQMYENFKNGWAEANTAPAEAVADAPPTLGGDLGATTPPTAPKEQSLGDAIKSFMNDQAINNDPPPIS